MAPGSIPAPGPPTAEEKAAADIRVVREKDQRPCVNTAGDEECAEFAKRGECEENKKWMSANCESVCRRCLDHMPFWHGGNVTHVAGKKALSALRKRDEKMVVMFHHEKACPDCNYARPFFAQIAAHILSKTIIDDIDIVAAVDCSRTEKTCLRLNLASATVRKPRPTALPRQVTSPDACHATVAAVNRARYQCSASSATPSTGTNTGTESSPRILWASQA